jgi:hypothetical protein
MSIYPVVIWKILADERRKQMTDNRKINCQTKMDINKPQMIAWAVIITGKDMIGRDYAHDSELSVTLSSQRQLCAKINKCINRILKYGTI